ncbi:Bifunctional heparan sulfate N-deacetylase/N-sulfotransferase 2 [Echinococcus granulosus]|nr:Bifunctional heparan sulfate N-deacetylase/N-sulfotransferase 2 [Echinococcus granulosus]
MLKKFFLFFVSIGIIYLVVHRLSSENVESQTFFANVRSHNLRTFVPSRLPKNINYSKHTHPLILFVAASDNQISEDARLVISVVQSLRLAVYPLNLVSFLSQVHRLILAKFFQMVIFEDFLVYFSLPAAVKLALDDYCKANSVAVIAFFQKAHTLKGIPGNDDFAEVDPSYPLLLRRFAPSSSPKGFFLSRESDVLYVARGGQADERDLMDQLPPCRDWQRNYSRCFPLRRDGYPQLLSDVTASVRHFVHLLPDFISVLNRSCVSEESIREEYQKWRRSWAALVPRNSGDADAFQTVAFTQVPLGQGTQLERRSCAFTECSINGTVGCDSEAIYQSLVLKDMGKFDGIERLLFAYRPLQHWSTSLLLNDAIHHFFEDSAVLEYDLGLLRYVHIDIDDVFVASRGDRMTPADVENLVETQNRWRRHFMPGFTFHMGFSGMFFLLGNPQEQLGDEALIQYRHQFKWFCHTYSHLQPHLLSPSELLQQFKLNKQFAEEKDLPIVDGYAVAPHHSGVYPVIPHLYTAWKEVWNINVTTTEGYPKLFPPHSRRGFHYQGVQVLPRQVCGVYTSTMLLNSYPGGVERLDGMAFGGDLFDTLLFRPVNLYMTHYGNYAQDRLALYVFERVFAFLRGWTRLKVQWAPIWRLMEYHLAFNPTERASAPTSMPVHSDPCVNPRHEAIWFPAACISSERRLPAAIIVGPQKTGTTALLAFMAMHPNLQPNRFLSHPPYEEVQFFSNSTIYSKGVAFYNDQFYSPVTGINFEKSATYFDSSLAVVRMAALLPKAKIIVLLRDPMLRAHSWYQHQRAHKVPVALNFTFTEVLNASSLDEAMAIATAAASSSFNAKHLAAQLYQLHLKCVEPSVYATHFRHWLHHYRANRILLVDVERLESDPAEVLRDVQEFLNVSTFIDYSKLLVWSERKGYYCARGGPYPKARQLLKRNGLSRDQWCLSESKGRSYNHSLPSATNRSTPFAESNRQLASLILQYPFWRPSRSHSATDLLPRWLRDL